MPYLTTPQKSEATSGYKTGRPIYRSFQGTSSERSTGTDLSARYMDMLLDAHNDGQDCLLPTELEKKDVYAFLQKASELRLNLTGIVLDELGGYILSFYAGQKLHTYNIMNSGLRLLILSNGDGTSVDSEVSPNEAATRLKGILRNW